MRTTSLASVGRIRRSTTLASMTRLLPEDPNILTPEYQMDYISAIQHISTLQPSASARQHFSPPPPSGRRISASQQVLPEPPHQRRTRTPQQRSLVRGCA